MKILNNDYVEIHVCSQGHPILYNKEADIISYKDNKISASLAIKAFQSGIDRVSGIFNYKVNAISLLQFSSQLKELCIRSGGKQIQVKEDYSVYEFSEENRGTAVFT